MPLITAQIVRVESLVIIWVVYHLIIKHTLLEQPFKYCFTRDNNHTFSFLVSSSHYFNPNKA